MRLRKPVELESIHEEIPSLEQYHAEYQVKVITPVYGGGVNAGEPDEAMPVRASAIRGQLRYWWRFLQSHEKEHDSQALFEEESNIWGGMGDAILASKVFLQIKINDKIEICSPDEYNKPEQNNRSALGYALFPVIQNEHTLINPEQLTFKLKIKAGKNDLNDAQWQAIQDSIRWWACFGGIGARTRRGLGAVGIDSIKPVTPEEAKALGCSLILLHASKDPIAAWNKSIAKLQTFRQGKNVGRNTGSDPKNPKKLGRSFWPEADSIRDTTHKSANGRHPVEHKATGYFPRAALGLPIIFDFNAPPQAGEPATTELKPIHSERMASPLILKPMAVGNSQYAPIALLLPTDHLSTLKLELMQGNNRLKQLQANTWWPLNTAAQEATAKGIPPMNGRGTDALTAFLNYFGGH